MGYMNFSIELYVSKKRSQNNKKKMLHVKQQLQNLCDLHVQTPFSR